MVDYSICGIELDKEKPYSKTTIIRKGENGNYFRRELQMDSTGVREFFAWAVHIFRVVYENKVVFADEMDRVLNPILSDRVIAFVNGAEHNGQFIFSTHNVLHLDLKTFDGEHTQCPHSRTLLHKNYYSSIKNDKKNDMKEKTLMAICVGMKLNSRLTQELFKKSVNNYQVYVDPYETYTLIMEQFPGLPIDDFNEILSRKRSFFMLIFEKCK